MTEQNAGKNENKVVQSEFHSFFKLYRIQSMGVHCYYQNYMILYYADGRRAAHQVKCSNPYMIPPTS
jgi:hypothetical protein